MRLTPSNINSTSLKVCRAYSCYTRHNYNGSISQFTVYLLLTNSSNNNIAAIFCESHISCRQWLIYCIHSLDLFYHQCIYLETRKNTRHVCNGILYDSRGKLSKSKSFRFLSKVDELLPGPELFWSPDIITK